MSEVNAGFAVVNDAPIDPNEKMSYCVLGMPRGGTTMTIKLIQALGVFVGDRMPITAEDPEFVTILKEAKPDEGRFDALVKQRFEQYDRWGFKAPFRNHWRLLKKIPNCRFVIVFRDVLAVANRNRISADADLLGSMASNITLQGELTKFAASHSAPMALISYEKAVVDPDPVIEGLVAFCGFSVSAERLNALRAVVRPGDPEYLDVAGLRASNLQCSLDIVNWRRVAGWVRDATGKPVDIQIIHDGRVVADLVACNYRRDLADHFSDHGCHGFDVPVNALPAAERKLVVEVRSKSSGAVLARRTV